LEAKLKEANAVGSDGIEEKKRLIVVRDLNKMFRLSTDLQKRIKYSITNKILKRLNRTSNTFDEKFWALKDISFSVSQGEVLGVIGKNGSGKTTLLQLIAGISEPSGGTVQTFGKISTLLELGSGFHRDFTGRENVYISGMISGFSRKEIDRRIGDIIRFADISGFIDQPVKTYSSGMFLRLSFATQTHFDPEILLIDEVLSVGDIFFQQKCHEHISKFINKGAATVIVSHDHYVIEKYCSRVMVLDKGKCVFLGDPNVALQKYFFLNQTQRKIHKQPIETDFDNSDYIGNTIDDWPSEETFLDLSHAKIDGKPDLVKLIGVSVCDEKGNKCLEFEVGQNAYFYYEFEVMADMEAPLSGLAIINRMNVMVHAKTTVQNGIKVPPKLKKGMRLQFSQVVRLSLQTAEYTFMIGLASLNQAEYAFAVSQSLFELGLHNNLVLTAMHLGPISIKSATKGLDPPFFGYADLEGRGSLSILNRRSLP